VVTNKSGRKGPVTNIGTKLAHTKLIIFKDLGDNLYCECVIIKNKE
jgi:hypothetical protein